MCYYPFIRDRLQRFWLSDLPKVTQSVAESGTKPGCRDFPVLQQLDLCLINNTDFFTAKQQ